MALALAGPALGATPAPSAPTAGHSLPQSIELGYESIRLPASERLGLMSSTLLFEVTEGWWLGPGVHGAAQGDRGGLFVVGPAVERRWALAPRWHADLSLYLGGGGGAGAPVGGGLMVRPAARLLYDLGAVRAGLSLLSVRFPSGSIQSRGVGLTLEWNGRYRYASASRQGDLAGPTDGDGLGFADIALLVSHYQLHDGSGRNLKLIGARATQRVGDDAWAWGMETSAAADGHAAGYMEILGGLGVRHHLTPSLQVGLRAGLGLGGGGAVPTRGGAIAKATAAVAWQLSPRWQVGAEVGRWQARDAGTQAPAVGVWLLGQLEPPPGAVQRVDRYAWSGGVQHVARARRQDGRIQALDAFGGAIDLRLSERRYATAQVYSAFAGAAGAYSVGLVGLGADTPTFATRWNAGTEWLFGAAGGGGVATGGGAILQAVGWVGPSFGHDTQLRLGLGHVRSLRGAAVLRSPLVQLMWTQPFGLRGH